MSVSTSFTVFFDLLGHDILAECVLFCFLGRSDDAIKTEFYQCRVYFSTAVGKQISFISGVPIRFHLRFGILLTASLAVGSFYSLRSNHYGNSVDTMERFDESTI